VTGPINVGNPGEFTMIELAETVLKLVGSKSKLVRQPLPADDPKQRKPDITARGPCWAGSRKFSLRMVSRKQSPISGSSLNE
jgi:nucleoside-diphosphate-sugar epimerase